MPAAALAARLAPAPAAPARSHAPSEESRVLLAALRDHRRTPAARLARLAQSLTRRLFPMTRDARHLRVGTNVLPLSSRDADGIDWAGFPAPAGVEWSAVGPEPRLWLPAVWPAGRARLFATLTGDGDGFARALAYPLDGLEPPLELGRAAWENGVLVLEAAGVLPWDARALALEPCDGPAAFRVVRVRASVGA